MPELLGWWVYVVGVPLGGGALLTLFSLGGRGKKGARPGKSAPKSARAASPKGGRAPAKIGAKSGKVGTVPKGATVKAATGKVAPGKAISKAISRQTRAAELPPLFLVQNFLLLWSLVALIAAVFQPQNAAPAVLTIILGAITLITLGLLAGCAHLFMRITPVDESSISHKSDLQGRIGECDATTDAGRGSLLVRDEFGTLHHLAARSNEPIARGEAVLLIEYQVSGDYFLVRSWRD